MGDWKPQGGSEVLDLADQRDIKLLREKKHKSLRQIADETGFSVPTVRKYANKEDFNADNRPRKRQPHYPKLGPYLAVIDGWLEGYVKVWHKQRHTAKRVFDRLREERSFDGSYSTVRRYVKKKRDELRAAMKAEDRRTAAAIKKGCIARVQDPGVAEADFCDVDYVDGAGETRRAHLFVLSFVYSNRGFAQVCPSENQQCFMQCLKDCFERIGGVPRRLRIDNACTAVIPGRKPGEKAVLTEGFEKFRQHHHGFAVDVCNLNSGQEKGNVENHVGAFRRNLMVPVPVITSLAEYNKGLWGRCDERAKSEHYRRHKPVMELWEKDRGELLELPRVPYEVFRIETVTVDKCGYVKLETNRYGLSPELCGLQVMAKAYSDHVEFLLNETRLASYPRLYGRDREICQWEMYLPTLLAKPGALEHSRFYDTMPMLVRKFLVRLHGPERKKGIRLLMEMVSEGGAELCGQVLELAKEKGRWNPDNARQIYCFLIKGEPAPEPLALKSSGPALNYAPDLTAYDQLARGYAHA